jgi:hypothetical protein
VEVYGGGCFEYCNITNWVDNSWFDNTTQEVMQNCLVAHGQANGPPACWAIRGMQSTAGRKGVMWLGWAMTVGIVVGIAL